MPQMSPLNWLILFIMFFVTYLLFLTMNYFNKNYMKTTMKKIMMINTTFLNWKW